MVWSTLPPVLQRALLTLSSWDIQLLLETSPLFASFRGLLLGMLHAGIVPTAEAAAKTAEALVGDAAHANARPTGFVSSAGYEGFEMGTDTIPGSSEGAGDRVVFPPLLLNPVSRLTVGTSPIPVPVV